MSTYQFNTVFEHHFPFTEKINFYDDMIRISLGHEFKVNSFPCGCSCLELSCKIDGNAELYIDYVSFNDVLKEKLNTFTGTFSIKDKKI